jgi:hypothetical protein
MQIFKAIEEGRAGKMPFLQRLQREMTDIKTEQNIKLSRI